MKTGFTARSIKTGKRAGALLICLIMLLGLLPGAFVISASALSGHGTAGNPYIITTWDEFDQIMRLNDGNRIYVEIGNDIEWRGDDGYFSRAIPVAGDIVLDLKGHFLHKYCKGVHTAGGSIGYHSDGAGYGKILSVSGTLVVNDTVGGGLMQVDGELVDEYYWQSNSYDCHEQVLIAEDGGRLTINGGNYIAGGTKEMYCAAAYVVEAEGKNCRYLDSDYNGYAWRVDSGTAVTANSGSTVIIRGGSFTGVGYEDLGCDYEGANLNIYKKQAALEINSGSTVRIYNGSFHGDGGANIVNYNGGDVEVRCAAFTVKSPRIIVGARSSSTLVTYRIEYDTSKKPGTVGIPASAFKKETGGVFHVGAAVFDYAPGTYYGDFGFGPIEPLPEPSLNVSFDDPELNAAGKIEWAPYSSRTLTATGANKYYPDGCGMLSGDRLYYLESTGSNWIRSGYGWTIYDVDDPASYKQINHFGDDLDLNWFCTNYNSVVAAQSAGFQFRKGHTYAIKYRHFICYYQTVYVNSEFYEIPERIYIPNISLPYFEYSSFNNTWSRPVGSGINNYELTLNVLDLNNSMRNTVELRLVDDSSEVMTSEPIIDADGGVVTFSVKQTGEMKVGFTDKEKMIKTGKTNKLALRVSSSNTSTGEHYETEFAFDVYCPLWVTTDRDTTDEQIEMDHLSTLVRCVSPDKVTLKHNNNCNDTKRSYWEYTPEEGGTVQRLSESNGKGSDITVDASMQGSYCYKAFSDAAGTKLVYSSNCIFVDRSNCYYVQYDAGEGTGGKSDTTVGKGQVFTVPANPFNPPVDKKFLRWRCSDGKSYYPGDTVTITQDITLEAVYVSENVTLSFKPGDGSGYMAPVTVNNWVKYPLPECDFTAAYRRFKYWQDENGYYYTPGYEYTPYTDMTFTAVWDPLDCVITFDRNGGQTDMDPGSAKYGSKYTLPICTCLPPSGMAFDCYEINGVRDYYPGNKIDVAGDVTVKVCWTEPILLSFAACNIAAPVAGERPDMNPVSVEPDKYEVFIEEWTEYLTGNVLRETSTFGRDVDYQATVVFAPKSGYTFSKSGTTFTINGQPATVKGVLARGAYCALKMSAPDSDYTVLNARANIEAPQKGQTPAEVNATIQPVDPDKYTVEVHHWTYVAEGSVIIMRTNIDTFKSGIEYQPYLIFTPVGDYSFNSETVYTLNSQIMTKDPYREWCSGAKFLMDPPESGTVSGGITSPFPASEPLTISLYRSGSDLAAYSISVPGNSASYAIYGVDPGNYTLVVSKDGAELFSKYIKVDGDVTCDIVVNKFMKGDFDFDGEITVADALAALRIAAKLVAETYDSVQIGDTDGDGHVTVSDALAILRVAAKLADRSSLG